MSESANLSHPGPFLSGGGAVRTTSTGARIMKTQSFQKCQERIWEAQKVDIFVSISERCSPEMSVCVCVWVGGQSLRPRGGSGGAEWAEQGES